MSTLLEWVSLLKGGELNERPGAHSDNYDISYLWSHHEHKWKSLMGGIFFFFLFNGARSGYYFFMVFYYYLIAVSGFYSLLPLGSCSVLLGSYSIHITLCMKLWWFCALIFIKPTIKNTKRNNTKQKNPYYKNIIIEALNKEDKEKSKNIFVPYFPHCFLIHIYFIRKFFIRKWASQKSLKPYENVKEIIKNQEEKDIYGFI